MKEENSTSTAAIAAEASRWAAREDAGLSEEDRRSLESWCAADPRHAEAIERYRRLLGRLSVARSEDRQEAMRSELGRRETRRKSVRRAAGMSAAVAALFFCFVVWHGREGGEPVGTPPMVRILVPETRVLPDGSVMELNGGAQVSVHFSEGSRRVRLERGEAHFQVQKDAARPFVVEAGAVCVRAVGTGFVVRHEPRAVGVVVNEGVVRVEAFPAADTVAQGAVASEDSKVLPSEEPAPIALLSAGNRVSVALGRQSGAHLSEPVSVLSEREIQELQAWRQPHVEFSGTPLSEVVRVINRQGVKSGSVRLALADPALGAETLSGRFRINDPEVLLRALEIGFGLRVDVSPDGTRVLRRKE